MARDNRIWFAGNPWPEGHPIKEFAWTAEVRNGVVWLLLHLETADYSSERVIEESEDNATDHDSNWEAPIVWNNYHRCTISSTQWPPYRGGFPICPVEQFSPDLLDCYEAVVDSLPGAADKEWDGRAFHIYLLGHDAVAGHRIKFQRSGDADRFDIAWTGKIALAYIGDYDFRHDFKAQIFDVQAPKI
jgi:hypothetical protein